jgi:predicted nucleic acid-binding protein
VSGVLVDSNVLLDVLTEDPRWFDWSADALARCFESYRRRGGEKRSPLPGFYIGAHAAVSELSLLTRDPARYRTYFAKLTLIAP